MEALDPSIMTRTLEKILAIFKGGAGRVQDGGIGLLSTLILIELVWAGINWALASNGDVIRKFFGKLILVGSYAFLVLNWMSVANVILDGFVWAGGKVGGTSVPIGTMRDPSSILEMGMEAMKPMWESTANMGLYDVTGGFVVSFLMVMVTFFVLCLYFLVALQAYMAVLEFYIVAAFGAIFIPWGINKHTQFIAERYFGAILAQGTKLMVLAALVATLLPMMEALKLTEEPTLYELLSHFFGMATIVFVVWRAPNMASGMMAGSASLHGSDAVESAAGTAMTGAVVGASLASGGSSTVAKEGGSAVTSATSSAATGDSE